MMNKDEALQLALEALEVGFMGPNIVKYNQAITDIKEALAQPEQEPVEDVVAYHSDGTRTVRIAPKRPWVGLTDDEIWGAVDRIGTSDSNVNPYQTIKDARAIEAKSKEKNFD